MNILIACEFTGIVRDAFIAKGHNAVSCDLIATERPGKHYTGDVRDILGDGWDMMIAHPPCTYLCNAGVRWLYEEEGRGTLMYEAADFFIELLNCEIIPKRCIENPVMHGYATEWIDDRPTQYIQSYEHGEPYSKKTGLWLRGLPKLTPTKLMQERKQAVWLMGPSSHRAMDRSRTYLGVAIDMAEQWG